MVVTVQVVVSPEVLVAPLVVVGKEVVAAAEVVVALVIVLVAAVALAAALVAATMRQLCFRMSAVTRVIMWRRLPTSMWARVLGSSKWFLFQPTTGSAVAPSFYHFCS